MFEWDMDSKALFDFLKQVKISFEQGLTLSIGYTDEALSIKTSAIPSFISSGLLGNNQVEYLKGHSNNTWRSREGECSTKFPILKTYYNAFKSKYSCLREKLGFKRHFLSNFFHISKPTTQNHLFPWLDVTDGLLLCICYKDSAHRLNHKETIASLCIGVADQTEHTINTFQKPSFIKVKFSTFSLICNLNSD